ncbi:polyprenyl synthetase family protein [Thermomonas haemolytica]|uniref:Farnesyl-diphosphate synthase n=1 Tax=Thermomonas haemolytica TaxID=141949 RepID=A0A4R3NFS6_9GAMM|nr:farnesyl diphosphate synthase [Thermomonas haemolytica]TCT26103.1 farnesyl-diphosphate synthase [Thermomonas haemolytica]TNY28619.1 geranyl transferase [Thermomonas haemolytica]
MTEAALARWRARVEAALEAALPDPARDPQRLHAAMRHGVLNGGKRMRPLLVYATGSALGASDAALDAAAVAVELVHCYSLVHDDLPAMDNDALRRGQPTVHVAFDEATAILAGDALQALAFEQLATAPQASDVRIAMLAELARAAGVAGMCGGQALDIDATGRAIDLPALERLHALKTGALLRCAVRLGALAGHATPEQSAALDSYAEALGLAFQIKDDLLDIEGDSATLGKTAGKDIAQDKATFPALLGSAASQARLQALSAQMQAALDALAIDTEALSLLARQVVQRQH